MKHTTTLPRLVSLLLTATALGCGGTDAEPSVVDDPLNVEKTVVGKLLFFDTNLSSPSGQACASCHDPEMGFAEPNHEEPVSRGVLPWLVGNRNAPTAAYAAFSPSFQLEANGRYVGGQFWDGRAATLAEQAKGPFLNPVEMHNPDKATVVASVEASAYADLFARVYGEGVFTNVEAAYDDIADAIAAYEATADVNRFTSKYDFVAQGKATFTEAEARGQEVFTTSGKCVTCHAIDPLADGTPPLFTTFGYANVGAPKNPALPFYDLPADYNPDGKDFVDRGLGAVLGKPEQDGKHKIPTLRNIDRTAPYMHNGVFRTLDEVVRFLSTRDTDPSWGAPEVAENVTSTVGKLGLTEAEISDLVAFLRTLSDGYVPTGK